MSVLPPTPLPGQASTYGRIWDIAAAILTNVAPVVPPVDRVYVSPGDPVAEFGGDQLTVTFATLHQGLPGIPSPPGAITVATNLAAEYHVDLLRELPSAGTDDHGQPLTADQLNLVSAMLLSDAQALVNVVVAGAVDWTLVGVGTLVSILGLDRVGPEGGVVGHRLRVEVSLT